MINRATPIGATVCASSITEIAKCLICDGDLARYAQPITSNWYHIRTGRALCYVGIHPSEKLVDQFVNNL